VDTTPAVGDELPRVEMTSTLQTSVAYAGASGDMNPLHYDPSFAEGVSPTGDVIAHGMFSMGLASRALSAWAGDPAAVADVEVRFTKPWPVGATASFGGTVSKVADGVATVRLDGTLEDGTVILKGTGSVRL
jgi:acyl dehydratase